ncbi:hypothetical protein DFJ58DRAFT_445959 [Suillus subalutaceus]|uniref:uncharacterized protein n=1 Tax=Suillus subalutaceus TaxID=48586 RepID=UPI001B866339|nr:uncharacterized protein DFJ58DRAFT_445959 [Suillus subalutaceus]KAG1849885.1 hypothetical protein DFJ58DRAFT_445959 [Suillus subalutaceus]
MTQSTSHPSSSYGFKFSSAMQTHAAAPPYAPVGQKHFAEDLEDSETKRIKMGSGDINNDPYFKPVLDQYGQHDGTYVCSKDGMVVRPGSHIYDVKTAKHLCCGLVLLQCPLSPETCTRRGVCKRHWDDGCRKLAAEGTPPYSATYQGSMGSASASSVGVPTAAFTFSLPTTATTTPDTSPPETILTEATEHAESWAANEVQDLALVAPVLPPSRVLESTFAEGHGDLDFWRGIDDIEDFVDPVLPISEPPSFMLPATMLAVATEEPGVWNLFHEIEDFVDPVLPISEPSTPLLPETMIAEAIEDPAVWNLINEIEESVDPDLPLCESFTDAAEDPDFCRFPIRTLFISSWLNNS